MLFLRILRFSTLISSFFNFLRVLSFMLICLSLCFHITCKTETRRYTLIKKNFKLFLKTRDFSYFVSFIVEVSDNYINSWYYYIILCHFEMIYSHFRGHSILFNSMFCLYLFTGKVTIFNFFYMFLEK